MPHIADRAILISSHTPFRFPVPSLFHKSINKQFLFTGQYFANKKVYAQMLQAKNKKKFRQEHASALSLYEEARKYLKELHPDRKIPSIDMLKTQKENLQIQKKAQLDTYHYFKEYQAELRTVCKNVEEILQTSSERGPQKEHMI